MMHRKRGKLILISGPMYAGKSRKLIQIYNELVNDKQKAIAIAPSEDNRTEKILSRTGTSIPTIKVEKIKEIENKINNYNFIFIDEFHFFNEELISIIKKISKKNKTVVLSGLDKDFKAINFEAYDKLKNMADQEIKMTAICHTCKKIAAYSRKDETKSTSNKRIEVDNLKDTIYFSSCGECHPYINKENE
jgi:thymidine kinase